jgi:3-phosphoshikimate 1-carboxyvinyltransferase
MSDAIEIRPTGPLRATIRPPGSKSITNRALVCAALAEGESLLTGALDSEDTRVMIEALRQLGIAVEHNATAATVRVVGCGGRLPAHEANLHVANSGTTARFLTAVCTLGQGTFRLDGTPRMRERPMEDLLGALRQLGADAVSELDNGCLPVVVRGNGLPGGWAELAGSVSSQFLSALLLAAPYADGRVALIVQGELVSQPYVDMTLAVMASFGKAGVEKGRTYLGDPATLAGMMSSRVANIQPGAIRRHYRASASYRYRGRRYAIEPDASAAGYFFAAAAITQGEVTVEGLSRNSLQGDVAFCECLRQMGCQVCYAADRIIVVGRPLRGIDVDMNAISDAVPTLGAVALFAAGPTTIRGVAHIRHKESDRIHALAVELRRLGAEVEERSDGLRITPRPLHGAEIETYDDHRLAMSLALVGLAVPGVVIRNPGCVAKTYPRFFADLAGLA